MSEKKVLSCHSPAQPLKELLDFRKFQKYNHSGLDIDLSPSKFFRKKNGLSDQRKAMASLLNSSSLPKWIKDLILSELRLLFLRTRNLDVSQKNQIVKV